MMEGFLKLMLLAAIGVTIGSAVAGGLIGKAAEVPVTTTAPIGAVVGAAAWRRIWCNGKRDNPPTDSQT